MKLSERLRNAVGVGPFSHAVSDDSPVVVTAGLLREAAELARRVEWQPVPPAKAGRYIVGATGVEPREARWKPVKGCWIFPSAQSAFTPTRYLPMPRIAPEAGQEVG